MSRQRLPSAIRRPSVVASIASSMLAAGSKCLASSSRTTTLPADSKAAVRVPPSEPRYLFCETVPRSSGGSSCAACFISNSGRPEPSTTARSTNTAPPRQARRGPPPRRRGERRGGGGRASGTEPHLDGGGRREAAEDQQQRQGHRPAGALHRRAQEAGQRGRPSGRRSGSTKQTLRQRRALG